MSGFVFHQGFLTLENNKSISFLEFGNPDKTLALQTILQLVVGDLSHAQQSVNI